MAFAFLIGALSRACLLLAFSEYVFFNEEPGLAIARVETPLLSALALGEAVIFYLLPGSLMYLMEPLITSWRRAVLVGAFIGWSIEASMVPVAYENVPFSYFWPSVSWHAVADVCFGVLLLRAALSWRLPSLLLLLAALGPAWAIWSTWIWEEIVLTPLEYGKLVAAVVLLLVVGMALMRPAPVPRLGRIGTGIVLTTNLGLWAVWAVFFPIGAVGLAILAAVTGFALWRGRAGPEAPQISLKGAVPIWRYSLLVALGALAWISYVGLLTAGLYPESALMVGSFAIFGIVWFLYALIAELVLGPRNRARAA